MKKLGVYLVVLLLATGIGCGGGSDSGGETRLLTYQLTDQSRMFTVAGLRRPSDERTLAGEFDVVIQEQDENRIAFEIMGIRLHSVEDDLYDVTTASGGTVTIKRTSGIDAAVAVSVNGASEEMFKGSMSGSYYGMAIDEDPPVFGTLGIRNDSRDFAERERVTYIMVLYATTDGRAVPTPEPLEKPLPTRGPKEGMN